MGREGTARQGVRGFFAGDVLAALEVGGTHDFDGTLTHALTILASGCKKNELPLWRYRLGVRTSDSQSENPGSIPGSATKSSA